MFDRLSWLRGGPFQIQINSRRLLDRDEVVVVSGIGDKGVGLSQSD